MYCVLKIYLEIGNFRGGEIVDMKILDTDTEDKINYINVIEKENPQSIYIKNKENF